MDSLANYGSDDDYEDSPDERQTDWRQADFNRKNVQPPSFPDKQADANYEEVQMDLSEESNDGSRNGKETRDRDSSGDEKRHRDSPSDARRTDDYRDRNRRGSDRSRERSRSRERRDARDDERTRERKDDRHATKVDRYNRDDRSKKDSYRDRKYRRSSSRDRRATDSKERRRSDSKERGRSGSRERKRSDSKERRRSSSKDRRRSNSRGRRRSSSRERRYSRSPKRDRYRRSRSRSRSRSRGKYGGPQRRYGYPKNNVNRNVDPTEASAVAGDKNRFFMPGITGKYREQIEKRKLLWQKKEPQKPAEAVAAPPQIPTGSSTSRVTKIWEATTFAQDQDGKVASKFKRLMGIKGQVETTPAPPIDIIKKQEEMFSSMEQQYEVARTATHTMRGVGLGFSSNYPR